MSKARYTYIVYCVFWIGLALLVLFLFAERWRIAAAEERRAAVKQAEAAARDAAATAEAARRAALKAEDPAAWLAEIRARDEERWFQEAKEIDPAAYEEERQRRIALHLAEARATPAKDAQKNMNIYLALLRLDPDNETYMAKFERYEDRHEKEFSAALHPERFLTLEGLTWTKEGFGSLLTVSATLKNDSVLDMKDAEILCGAYAESGTALGTLSATIYRRIPAGGAIRITDFDVGFLPAQTKTAGCVVTGASVQKP